MVSNTRCPAIYESCMIVNLSKRKQDSGPERDEVLKNRGSFVRSFLRLSVSDLRLEFEILVEGEQGSGPEGGEVL